MIRVLCVFGSLDIGGSETMCMNLYRKIDRTKIQFDFVNHQTKKCAYEDEIIQLGGKIYRAPKFRLFNYFTYVNWWKNHFKNHPEHLIIHGHLFTISAIYFNVARKFNKITICHSHSTNFLNKSYFIKNIISACIQKISDYFLSCSEMAGRFLFPNKNFIILKNAIDVDSFVFNPVIRNRIRYEFGYSDSDIVICIVANFREPKNPLGTLEIFKHIHTRHQNAKLLWVGDGPLRTVFEQKVHNLGLDGAVKLLGVREDVFNVLQAADVFMLASFFEGLGISAIEAQASGLPCLLSDGIPRETAITDLCHFLPLDKPELWAKAVSELDLSKRRNTKSEVANADYDIEKTAKWLENFYISIIEKRNSNNGQ